MRLLEAIFETNRASANVPGPARKISGDCTEALPLIALTCIDPRLNPLLPTVLGISDEQFIWLRNAGNMVTGPTTSTLRSIALACAVKGGREIAIIGHTDCGVRKTTVLDLTGAFARLGVSRAALPDDLVGYFGLFASERQNVMNAVQNTRQSPLIGAGVPVHGLLIDIETGVLEWVVNGYENAARPPVMEPPPLVIEEDPPALPEPPVPQTPSQKWRAAQQLGKIPPKLTRRPPRAGP